MVYRGTIKEGVVVLDGGAELPDGTEVTVRPVKKPRRDVSKRKSAGKARGSLTKFAGKAAGLPNDASINVDHYLYGHPKR